MDFKGSDTVLKILKGGMMGLFRKKRKKFGEILIEKGLATKEDVDGALKLQKEIRETKQVQKKIGAILYGKGIIDLEDIDEVLEAQKNLEGYILKGWIYSMFHSSQPR